MAEVKQHKTLEEVIKGCEQGVYTRDDHNLYHSFHNIEERFGISASAFYQLMHAGKMPSLKKTPVRLVYGVTIACLKKAFDKGGAEIVEIMTDEQKREILNDRRIKSIIHYNKSHRHSYTSTWIGHKLIQHIPVDMISDENKAYFKEQFMHYSKRGARDSRYISIQGIDAGLMDDEMYMSACLINGDNLQYVPEDCKTEELCRATVKEHGSAILFVPEKLRQELYVLAIKSGEGLSNIPKEDRTEKICAIAVETNPEMFKAVPEEFKSYSMCLKVVEQDAELMANIPEEHIDEEMTVRFLVAIFNKNYKHDFVINSDWRDEGKTPLLKFVLEKVGATDNNKKRELVKRAIEHTEGKCFGGFLKVQREGWADLSNLVNAEISLLAVKLDIENFRIVPDDVAKDFWKRNLNK